MEIYSIADNIISPLGTTTLQNFHACQKGETAIKCISDNSDPTKKFYGAAIDRKSIIESDSSGATFLEKLFIQSITQLLNQTSSLNRHRTILILSTTKGNIDRIHDDIGVNVRSAELPIYVMAKRIGEYFNLPYIVVSNACCSGVSAIIMAKRLIRMKKYDHAIVSGGDLLSEFVVSGFQSFNAVSDAPCKPFDKHRSGISLGEGCGSFILTKEKDMVTNKSGFLKISGGSQSNDAHHISAPSRTGKGLCQAVTRALRQAEISVGSIGYINAHGTATQYNDEMEAQAFHSLGLNSTPLNSLKGYFGHTLGASGVIESILTMHQLKEGILLASKGFSEPGTSQPLRVLKENHSTAASIALKTSSGFGGCNAAVIFEYYGS